MPNHISIIYLVAFVFNFFIWKMGKIILPLPGVRIKYINSYKVTNTLLTNMRCF